MQPYRVKLYDGADKPKGEHRDVSAPSLLAAADQFCGPGTLREGGKNGQLRAEASLMSEPAKKHDFYRRYDSTTERFPLAGVACQATSGGREAMATFKLTPLNEKLEDPAWENSPKPHEGLGVPDGVTRAYPRSAGSKLGVPEPP